MSDDQSHRTTTGKALRVNLDLEKYGAFAEIGAGQEVARHFFQAGRASQTIAKSISAYDMIYSDEIYGKEKSGRYVCESRLNKMLEKEYNLLIRRLQPHRGDKTAFFAFANTVATGTAEIPKCHGWMGLRYQTHPQGQPNDIILHVRMMDRHRLQQQEALGVLGVNLIDSAFYHRESLDQFLTHLVDNIKAGQVMIDVLKFQGPDFAHIPNELACLELVNRRLSEAVLFSPQMEILSVGDTVYGKPLLIQRGSFRPVTNTHIEVLQKGLAQFNKAEALPLMELNVGREKMNVSSDLEKIKILAALGYHTLVSRFELFYELKSHLRRYTQKPIAIVMSALHLQKIMEESHYKSLEGGIFEGLGKLFDENTQLLIYPHKTENLCTTTKSFHPGAKASHLYRHFTESGQISDIAGCDEAKVYLHSDEVQKWIAGKNPSWEKAVPEIAKKKIKENFLFGYR